MIAVLQDLGDGVKQFKVQMAGFLCTPHHVGFEYMYGGSCERTLNHADIDPIDQVWMACTK